MARSRPRRKPSFLWQALLILLPVGVLAGVGFLSLRRDKILAKHEAAERAQTIADSLLPRLWSALTNADNSDKFEHHAFQIDSFGELVFPRLFSPNPSPQPLDSGDLSIEQAKLWEQAERAESLGPEVSTPIQAVNAFLSTKPPKRFAAIGAYNLGVLLIRQNQLEAAADAFLSVLERYPHSVAESGLSVDRLAEFKLVELGALLTNASPTRLISPDYFCETVILDPSAVTPSFLGWVSSHAKDLKLGDGAEKWLREWQEDEETRALYASARSNLIRNPNASVDSRNTPSHRLLWLRARDLYWLASEFGRAPGSDIAVSVRRHHSPSVGIRVQGNLVLPPNRNQNFVDLEFSAPSTAIESGYTNQWFLCRKESELCQVIYTLVADNKLIPEYFGIGVEIAGKQLRESAPDLRRRHEDVFFEGGGSAGRKVHSTLMSADILASAVHSEAGAELLKVSIYLTSPTALFKRQSERTLWFSSIVGASALAALIGLFSAWRAFNRQQELADMKNNFVSSVSHELRAPIASVRLMAESLEHGKIAEAPKQREYFRFISQECRRLSSLIENVLDFSRIEQGRKQYDFEPTDLLALLQQTVKLMQPYGFERQVSIVLKLSDHQASTLDYQLSLDGRAIQQALINLLDNAIKHSSNGQTVTVDLHASEKLNGKSVNISVQDDGRGIPPEEHEKIFERFYRLGSELRRETQGVGIGLSIVKHIVEAHGGRVRVESAPGKGSRFTMELPWNAS